MSFLMRTSKRKDGAEMNVENGEKVLFELSLERTQIICVYLLRQLTRSAILWSQKLAPMACSGSSRRIRKTMQFRGIPVWIIIYSTFKTK